MFTPDQMGIYFHWPFCASKCPYCDFNAHVHDVIDHDRWRDTYVRAIAYYAKMLPGRRVVSVFFGGGTPSLMPPDTVEAILDAVRAGWTCANDLEVTLEANPTSVEVSKLEAFRDAGVNRVSLGVQALNDKDLAFLGRTHDTMQAIQAIELARDLFERFSFDLIYARPGQSLDDWEAELKRAVDLARGHLSLYQLTIERRTPFYLRAERGEFSMLDEVAGAEFYHLTQNVLEEAGMPAYEVSNHAAEGHQCRHNLLYWHYADYLGIGPGAHGRFVQGGVKYASRDHFAPDVWLSRVEGKGCGVHPFEEVVGAERFGESLLMGLRLREGVDVIALCQAAGVVFGDVIDQSRLDKVCAEGWAVFDGTYMQLSREGWLRLNALLPYILL